MKTKALQFQQLSKKMETFSALKSVVVPPTGWVKAIRAALGISAAQLGHKLSITRQGVMELEKREKDGAVTIKLLQETARALDMQLVYGFVPNDGTLNALVERKAKELAIQIVMRTSANMQLEGQQNTPARIQKAIEERTEELKREMPKILWD